MSDERAAGAPSVPGIGADAASIADRCNIDHERGAGGMATVNLASRRRSGASNARHSIRRTTFAVPPPGRFVRRSSRESSTQ